MNLLRAFSPKVFDLCSVAPYLVTDEALMPEEYRKGGAGASRRLGHPQVHYAHQYRPPRPASLPPGHRGLREEVDALGHDLSDRARHSHRRQTHHPPRRAHAYAAPRPRGLRRRGFGLGLLLSVPERRMGAVHEDLPRHPLRTAVGHVLGRVKARHDGCDPGGWVVEVRFNVLVRSAYLLLE